MKKLESNVHTYLGFLHTYQDVARPSLEHYKDVHHFSAYISFFMAKKSGKGRLGSVISTAQMVAQFLGGHWIIGGGIPTAHQHTAFCCCREPA